MKERLELILNGDYDRELDALSFSCPRVELAVQPGQEAEGSFRIYGGEGRIFAGEVTVSDLRMECLNPEFEGSGVEIYYRFHARELEEGETVEGQFFVVSSQGEQALPFAVTVCCEQIETSFGTVSNLFHFANLAKGNPDEALRLFYSPRFQRILSGEEERLYGLYAGLSGQPGNRRCMDEFLISAGKKQKISYLTRESELVMDAGNNRDNPMDNELRVLNVTKSGWGFVDVRIEQRGDFFYTEKNSLSDDDFLGNHCELPVYIRTDRLHSGRNLGQLILRWGCDELIVPVIVRCGQSSAGSLGLREKRRLTVQLMEYYQDFRMKKITSPVWMQETGKLVERLNAMDPRDVSAKLLRAHLLITQERYEEADWILDRAAGELAHWEEETPVMWAYHLYLTTLVKGDAGDTQRAAGLVEKLYKRDPGEWRLAWLLLYLSREYSKSASRKLVFLEEQFERGCTSPVLYIEALTLINANPALLMKLGEFERQMLWYGARREYLSREVVSQAVYLIRRVKDYSVNVFRFLTACYEQQEDDGVLQEICTLLIRTGKTGPQYLHWYEKGIRRNLRITRLYDYYMMSLDLKEERELPRIVLMYFSYHSNLDYEINAYMYAYVIRNKEDFPELYLSYREQIERFLLEQIQKKRTGRDLAYLYQQALRPGMLNGQLAQNLAELLFVRQITVKRGDIRKVIVCQFTGREQSFPVTAGRAFAPIYGEEYTLLFEDGQGSRYGSGIEYTVEKLMKPDRLAEEIAPLVQGQLGFDLYRCMDGSKLKEVDTGNVDRFRHLWSRMELPEKYRMEMGVRLLQYYQEQDQLQQLELLLEEFRYQQLPPRVRGEVLRYLVFMGKLEDGDQLVRSYGTGHIKPQELLRLYSALLQEQTGGGMSDPREDGELTDILSHLFRKDVWDEYTLRYLCLYFRGTAKELLRLRKVSEELGVGIWELAGRILMQMLYTGEALPQRAEVFRAYAAGSGDPDVKAAFLGKCAYDYFVSEKEIERELLREMQYMYRKKEELPLVCDLAFLQYYAANPGEITGEGRQVIRQLAVNLVKEGIYLRFLAQYADLDPLLARAAEKTVLEYRTRKGARAVIHYVLQEEAETELRQVCGGVCFAAFTLFYGESLEYYIIEELDGEQTETERGVLRKSQPAGSREGKFEQINEIAMSLALQEDGRAERLLEDYYYKEYMRERLFQLL